MHSYVGNTWYKHKTNCCICSDPFRILLLQLCWGIKTIADYTSVDWSKCWDMLRVSVFIQVVFFFSYKMFASHWRALLFWLWKNTAGFTTVEASSWHPSPSTFPHSSVAAQQPPRIRPCVGSSHVYSMLQCNTIRSAEAGNQLEKGNLLLSQWNLINFSSLVLKLYPRLKSSCLEWSLVGEEMHQYSQTNKECWCKKNWC